MAAFRRWRLNAKVLVDVRNVDISTDGLRHEDRLPGDGRADGRPAAAHPDGELGTAAGVAATGSLFVEAINANDLDGGRPREVPGDGRGGSSSTTGTTDRPCEKIIRRAEEAGCSGIVPLVNTTADVIAHAAARRVPAAGRDHVRPLRVVARPRGFGLTEEYIEWMAKLTSLPIIPKGIVRGDDALRAVNAGARGIMVSNHGGRQLSHEMSTLDALPGVVEGRRQEGRRRSSTAASATPSDVLIALALGAKAVTLGRPVMWGLAVGGGEGVTRVLAGVQGRAFARRRRCAASRPWATCPADLAVRRRA